jgi:hypothetical protein
MNTLILIIGFVVLIRLVYIGLNLINEKLADIRTIMQDTYEELAKRG